MDWEAFYNSFRQPDFIPGYHIENRLGGGAFGDVYKARKTSIGKAYAIKFLKVENDDQREAVQRELDQVRHFAAIDHPNLVTIEDMGSTMDVPYLIMGYAGEETLAKRFKLGDLQPDEALRVFTQAARGVLALHDRRLVHFDLKPSNIFLRGDNARVGDYGLSKLLEGGRTTLSFGRGTPMYMAPEMLRSRADHRADIYSLGVILFESLAGRLPFEPEDHGGLILRETDDPPTFPPDFPLVARAATEACLRLDPKDRPTSVSEVLDLLGQTARPGDSVIFHLAPNEARPKRPAVAGAGADGGAGSHNDREPASSTARDLVSQQPAPAQRPPSSSPGAPEQRETSPLLKGGYSIGDDEEVGGPSPGDVAATTAANSPLDAGTPASKARLLVRELSARAAAEVGGGGQALPAPPAPTVIPVPPKVKGGLVATLAETTRVGFDVFIAAILAVIQSFVVGFRTVTDRLIRSDRGGILGRAVRFALFLMLMVSIGFGATLIGLFGLFVLEHAGRA